MNADSLWDKLSLYHKEIGINNEVIYRGHSNSDWKLLPTILRPELIVRIEQLMGYPINYERLVSVEFIMLRQFIYNCDQAGITIPNNSVRFREENLTDKSFAEYLQHPDRWPGNELLESMAMARLHGLPTRVLDWTTNPYVAVYFAASQALRTRSSWTSEQKLAIFVLANKSKFPSYHSQIRMLRVHGSISQNVVAQHGLFTVHPMFDKDGETAITKGLEEYLPATPSILKLTVPVSECVTLFELCNQFGFNSARLFPSADGASRSVIESQLYALANQRVKYGL